jgi:hypothetical protein
MRKNYLYILCSLLSLAFSSCGSPNLLLPPSSGRPYEVLVVAEQADWDSIAGHSLTKILKSAPVALPLHESSFKLMYSAPQHFDETLQLVRSIIMLKIDKRYSKSQITVQNDLYATPQCVLTIESPNQDDFSSFVEKQSKHIISTLSDFEMNSRIASLQKDHSGIVEHAVNVLFDNCEVFVPKELHDVKEGKDFLWASTGTPSVNQNFVMYSYPIDTQSVGPAYFIAKRDSVMKVNIPGHVKGSYMITEPEELSVEKRDKDRQGVSGLWRMKNDFMGGPFYSQVYFSHAKRKIYVVEVFVYAPDRPKGNLIRSLGASLFTLKIPGAPTQTTVKDNK